MGNLTHPNRFGTQRPRDQSAAINIMSRRAERRSRCEQRVLVDLALRERRQQRVSLTLLLEAVVQHALILAELEPAGQRGRGAVGAIS